MMWFELIRPACLRTLGLSDEPLTAETFQVSKKVSTDVRLFQRCVNEVNEQQTAKEEENQLRQAIVQAFSKICVESCERIVLRPLLLALDLLGHSRARPRFIYQRPMVRHISHIRISHFQ